jgi:hypothetical protein
MPDYLPEVAHVEPLTAAGTFHDDRQRGRAGAQPEH